MSDQIIIGVAGGSGSGKTTVTHKIMEVFTEVSLGYIEHDAYYKDQSDMTMEERFETNYDHPLAFDTDLLKQHLRDLSNGKAINMPVYDYSEYTRSSETILVEPKDVILVEGILIFDDPELRDLMDIKVFVDTQDDIRILRRIQRDMSERGRSLQSVIDQYIDVVKPMHEQFVEPSKRFANIIIPEGGENAVAIDIMQTKIQSILNKQNK